jgi:acyl-CoA synthetase (AMP-forming)/AMP-acid ligase II
VSGGLFDLRGHGDNVAFIDGDTGQRISYAELASAAAAVSKDLARAKPSLVVQFAENTVASLVAYYGALGSGHAVCLLDPMLPKEKRDFLIDTYRPAFLIEGGRVTPAAGDPVDVHPELAVLLSTSGSTGSPKLVRLARSAIRANACAIVDALGVTSDDRTITSLPPSYAYGLSVLHSYAEAGASIVVTRDAVGGTRLWPAFEAYGCTSFSGVSVTYDTLVRQGIHESPPPSLRALTQAGGRMAIAVAEIFHATMESRGGRFIQMYGQTEATARMSCLQSEDFSRKRGSCGKAIPGGRFRIAGPAAQPGEVIYEGPNVMMGYAERAQDLARGDDLHGVLHTGDIGSLDDEGFLTLTGRLTRMVKIFGSRLNLDDVEAIGAQVARAAAVGRDDRVLLFVETSAPQIVKDVRRTIVRALRLLSDGVEVRGIERLPLTSNGKPDYRALSRCLDE